MNNKMYHHLIVILGSIFSTLLPIESAKILGIFPILSKSHHSVNQPIVRGLAARGHDVTVICHFKSTEIVPNYREILFSEGVVDFVDTISIEDSTNFSGIWKMMSITVALEKSCCDTLFGLDYIQQLIRNSNGTAINLIIAEIHYSKCLHLLAHKLRVPLILILPVSLGLGVDYFVGNPFNPAVVPMDKHTTKMDFFQRLKNTINYVVVNGFNQYAYNKDMERYSREVFNMELPSNEELNKRTAMAFYNNHFSFMTRPLSPNAVDIAGIHIKEAKKLPKDIEEFIEGATYGVILFSFGTTIKASSISPEKLKVIIDVFSAIPQRILWRVNELNLAKVPPNVKLSKWFPQRDILEHKNVISFISHCGLQGTLEAIHTATPVIAIPLAFDQFQNANILIEKGAGVYVDYFTMDKNTLINAINEIVTNPKYRESMQKLSKIFKDRPRSALDEALYWSEYVLRHRGASHMRTAAADMPLYQYLLLDVLVFVLGILVCIVYFCKYSFKIMISILCHRKLKKNKLQ